MNNKFIDFDKPESISDQELLDYHFDVCVGTYGDYSRGNQNYGWISLPIPEDNLNEFLQKEIKVGPDNEEIMLQSFRQNPFGIREADNIYQLNDIATLWESLDDNQKLKVRSLSDANDGNLSLLELANGMLKVDEIPYKSYNVDTDTLTRYEKMGYTEAEESGLYKLLEDFDHDGKALSGFDFAWYGKLLHDDHFSLYEHGYYDECYSVTIDYDFDAIHQKAIEIQENVSQPSIKDYEAEIKAGREQSQENKRRGVLLKG